MWFSPWTWNSAPLYTLSRVLEGAQEFAQPVHMCFMDLEKAFDHVPRGVLWGSSGIMPIMCRASLFGLFAPCMTGFRVWYSKSDLFPVRVGLRQGCPLSLILFITLMDRISRRSHGVEGVRFWQLRIGSLLFVDDMVLVAKRELSRKKSFMFTGPIFVLTLTYGHKLWIVTERTKSCVQAAEMGLAVLSLRDRVRSSAILEELGVS